MGSPFRVLEELDGFRISPDLANRNPKEPFRLIQLFVTMSGPCSRRNSAIFPSAAMRRTCSRCSTVWNLAPTKDRLPNTKEQSSGGNMSARFRFLLSKGSLGGRGFFLHQRPILLLAHWAIGEILSLPRGNSDLLGDVVVFAFLASALNPVGTDNLILASDNDQSCLVREKSTQTICRRSLGRAAESTSYFAFRYFNRFRTGSPRPKPTFRQSVGRWLDKGGREAMPPRNEAPCRSHAQGTRCSPLPTRDSGRECELVQVWPRRPVPRVFGTATLIPPV